MKQADKPLAAELIKSTLKLSKLQTISGIYNRVRGGEDERSRTKLAPYTETGRLRSGEDKWWPEPTTNWQNLPKKQAKLNKLYEVRNIVIPSSGCVFLEGDLSQAEVWATAGYAEDGAKLKRLATQDEHTNLAARIFEIPKSKVNRSTHRHIGKTANHGLNYGVGWKTFMEHINKDADITGVAIDAKLAKKAITEWRRLNPKTVRWWRAVKEEVNSRGYLVNCFGRKRIFLNPNTAGNDMIAYLPQSTIADLLNHALVKLYSLEDSLGFQVVLQIHDAILVEAPKKKWMKVAKLMKETMTTAMIIAGRELRVPVDVSMSAKNWGEMKELEL